MHFTEISTCIVNSVSVLLFLPLWVILIILLNSLCPLINSKRLTFNLSISTSLINLFFSIICLIFCIKNPSINIENNIIWLNSDVKVFLGTLVDNLSSVFLILYSIIFFLIQIFSYFKIKDTKNFHKFFIYLNLANFSIIGLILSTNLIQTLIFIIFTSVVCYLIMSCFSLEEQSELVVRKIFLLNYFGDISLLIGISVIVYFSSLFNVSQNLILLSYSDFIFHVDNFYSMFSEYTYVVILLFMLISIFIKMGQVPFFSSVLKLNEIKNLGAIIVLFCLSLGSIYLLARIYPMIILSVFVKNILIVVGMLSAFLGVYFSLSQNLLNKFLLSLGVSQFGLILLTIGLKGYSLAIYSYWVFLFAYLLLFFISYLLNKDGSINIKTTEKRLCILIICHI